MFRQNHVRKNESVVSDAEYRLSVAEEVCKALNITTSDTWRIIEEPGESFITIRSDGDNAIIDGTFCEVEVTNNWVSCFAYPTREGGDYILIGKFRCLDKNLLDKVTALDGCGEECALEAKIPSNRPLKKESGSKVLKFADIFVPDALWDKAGIAHGVRKVTKDLRSGMSRDEKWGSGSPFFQKTSVISTRLIHKNVKSIAGSKGLSPLAGVRAEPQKNFAYMGI